MIVLQAGGGASTGIELATGQPVTIAINHDESAILMHAQNHPYTEHYREDVWAIDPRIVTRGRHVRLAWFSPDCKHFSRAKGAALVDKKIRGLAWIVLRWAGTVRPDVIMLENVPEFVTWCPVRKGKPVRNKKGQTYEKWLRQLKALGYDVESKVLCAADYGAPTIRKRFCLIARCDGEPIVFPKRTHAPADSEEVKSGECKPWRTAAEIIDWTQPCYSIFESKESIKEKYNVRVNRPLKPNTLRRIAKGLDKFVLKSAKPFIVPFVFPYIMSNNAENVPRGLNEPVPTITAGNRNYYTEARLAPFTAECNHSGEGHIKTVDTPLNTVTAKCTQGVVAPALIQYHTEQSSDENRAQGLNAPLGTIDTSNRYGLAAMHLTQYFSGEGHYHSLEESLATITTMEREGVTAAYLSEYYGNAKDGACIDEPLHTVTSKDHQGVTSAFLSKFYSGVVGSDVREPVPTVTAIDHNGLVTVKIVKYSPGRKLGYWPQIRLMLNEYCGYSLEDDEVLLLSICGVWHFISDIGLRMLTPRELYNAQGFPCDYIIDKDNKGRPITRCAQVARCGNAVCPPLAEALVRANLPECSKTRYVVMSELHNAMVS